jgi:hypothetical protein
MTALRIDSDKLQGLKALTLRNELRLIEEIAIAGKYVMSRR